MKNHPRTVATRQIQGAVHISSRIEAPNSRLSRVASPQRYCVPALLLVDNSPAALVGFTVGSMKYEHLWSRPANRGAHDKSPDAGNVDDLERQKYEESGSGRHTR